ncbi:uncharacterized protein LOC144924953 [Branchiostoma floridae x Branchiostoma belcheri]
MPGGRTMASLQTTYPPARNAETVTKVRAMNDHEDRKRKVLLQQFEKENSVFMKNRAQEKKLFQGRLRNLQNTQHKMRSLSPTKADIGMASPEALKKSNRRPVTEYGPRRNVRWTEEDKDNILKEFRDESADHTQKVSPPSGTAPKDRKETRTRALTASDCFRKKMLELEREDHALLSTPPRVRHQLLTGRPRLQKETLPGNKDGVSREVQKVPKNVDGNSASTESSNLCLPSIAPKTATQQKDEQQSKVEHENQEASGAPDPTAARVEEWLNKFSSTLTVDTPSENSAHDAVKNRSHCDLRVSEDDAREWENVVGARRTRRRYYIHPATCEVMKPRNIVSRVEEMSGKAGILAWLGLETPDFGAILK